jgi:hypothetical protein
MAHTDPPDPANAFDRRDFEVNQATEQRLALNAEAL